MEEIRRHAHVYLVLTAAILVAIGGILSIWRMKGIEREIALIHYDYAVVIKNHDVIIANQNIFIADMLHIDRQHDQLIAEHAEILEHTRKCTHKDCQCVCHGCVKP